MKIAAIIILITLSFQLRAGEQIYMKPIDFVSEAFPAHVPESEVLWIKGELREQISETLGHPPGFLRVRYWSRAQRSVFILEEIGKERLITTGFVVENGVLERTQVLVFRESRGWEVRYPFFTDQFRGARLDPTRQKLDRKIDGISGATLSVRAVTSLSEVALLMEAYLRKSRPSDWPQGERLAR